jgi:hypothetical protein
MNAPQLDSLCSEEMLNGDAMLAGECLSGGKFP